MMGNVTCMLFSSHSMHHLCMSVVSVSWPAGTMSYVSNERWPCKKQHHLQETHSSIPLVPIMSVIREDNNRTTSKLD